MTYRLLVSGTRFGREDAEKWFQYVVDTYGEPELWIFRDAKGVDTQCKEFCERTNRQFHQFEADWDTLSGNHINTIMAEFTAEVPNSKCLALPHYKGVGTQDCIRKAKKYKLELIVR